MNKFNNIKFNSNWQVKADGLYFGNKLVVAKA